MAARKISYDMEAREAIRRGVKHLARTVKVTLGPCGRNVVIEKPFGSPLITKDGVTVAKEIELEDGAENIGAQLVKEVASKTSTIAGDGTTTATVYAEAIYDEGLKNVAAGANAMELKRGIEQAVNVIVQEYAKFAVPVKGTQQIAQVGTCAANHDIEIGKKIAEAMEKVGKDGVVTIEESQSSDTTVQVVEGMQFDRGYISPHFVTDQEEMEARLDKPFVLIFEKKISAAKDIVPICEKIYQAKRPLLLVAEDVDGEALATLVVNKLRGTLQCCAVKAPGYGDRRRSMLEDIAILTGGSPVLEDLGLDIEKLGVESLGQAKRIVVTKDTCTIIEGNGDTNAIKGRIELIKREADKTTSDYDREKLQECSCQLE